MEKELQRTIDILIEQRKFLNDLANKYSQMNNVVDDLVLKFDELGERIIEKNEKHISLFGKSYL